MVPDMLGPLVPLSLWYYKSCITVSSSLLYSALGDGAIILR
jgi:hypothetical protein